MPELTPETLALGAAWYAMFLLATTCHEAAHAWAALKGGDPTAYRAGQVSLNPLPHIQREPLGTVLVPLVTFVLNGWMIGWASAPYDPHWAERHPRRAAWMALAGPAANLSLLLAAAFVIRLGVVAGVFHAPPTATLTRVVTTGQPGWLEAAALLVSVMFTLNLLLFLFNLLPLPPLDGHAGVTLLMPSEMGASFREATRGLGFAGLLVAWLAFNWLFEPAFIFVLSLLYPDVRYG
jgi:Zn-dependent protease